MKRDRRQFVKNSATAILGLSTLPFIRCAKPESIPQVLILGGTNFLGPAVVEAAQEKGYAVTLFNRGITNPDLFSELPLIVGDRENGATAYNSLQFIK